MKSILWKVNFKVFLTHILASPFTPFGGSYVIHYLMFIYRLLKHKYRTLISYKKMWILYSESLVWIIRNVLFWISQVSFHLSNYLSPHLIPQRMGTPHHSQVFLCCGKSISKQFHRILLSSESVHLRRRPDHPQRLHMVQWDFSGSQGLGFKQVLRNKSFQNSDL